MRTMWRLIVTCAVVGMFVGCQVKARPFSTRNLGAEHPAATTITSALTSGALFSADSFAEQARSAAQARNALQGALDRFRAALADDTPLTFLEGAEFRGFSSGGMALCAFKGETPAAVSQFTLPPGADTQVYLLFSAKGSKDEILHVHFLMRPEQGSWKILIADCWPARVGDVDSDWAVKSGKAEEQAGRNVLALSLYQMADALAICPAYRYSGRQQRIRGTVDDLQQRLGLPKKVLWIYEVQGRRAEILDVRGELTAAGPYLHLYHRVASLDEEEELKSWQQAIAGACLSENPRIRYYYRGIMVATASAESGQGYRSVFGLQELDVPPASGPATQASKPSEP